MRAAAVTLSVVLVASSAVPAEWPVDSISTGAPTATAAATATASGFATSSEEPKPEPTPELTAAPTPASAPPVQVATVRPAPPPPASSSATVVASWYGPGFYGNRTACGQTYSDAIVGVAHKTLPCGSLVTLSYRGVTATVAVIDRGPFIAGREFDLSAALRRFLECPDLCRVEWVR